MEVHILNFQRCKLDPGLFKILVLIGWSFQRELVDNIHQCEDCEVRHLGIISAMKDVGEGLEYVLQRDLYVFFRF